MSVYYQLFRRPEPMATKLSMPRQSNQFLPQFQSTAANPPYVAALSNSRLDSQLQDAGEAAVNIINSIDFPQLTDLP